MSSTMGVFPGALDHLDYIKNQMMIHDSEKAYHRREGNHSTYSWERLESRIYKELLQTNNKNIENPMEK